MDGVVRYVSGGVAGLLSLFAPIKELVMCAVVFIAVDFVTGVAADCHRAKAEKRKPAFESGKAWSTVVKLVFVMLGIAMAWLIDTRILDFLNLRLANLFTGFVCGVEFWSYLENAAEISNHPVFRWLKKIMKDKLDRSIGNEQGPE